MVSKKWSNCPYGKKINGCFARTLSSAFDFLHGDIGWPVRLPDLSPCDYFLWGYVKCEVYKHRSTTIDGLKAAICKTINEILRETSQRVMENFRKRLQQCMAARGRHLEDVIFKKGFTQNGNDIAL